MLLIVYSGNKVNIEFCSQKYILRNNNKIFMEQNQHVIIFKSVNLLSPKYYCNMHFLNTDEYLYIYQYILT